MLICICVYIYKYISTDLFLEYFQHWKRETSLSDQTGVPQLSFMVFFHTYLRVFLHLDRDFIKINPANQQNRSSSKQPASQQFETSKKRKTKKVKTLKPSKIYVLLGNCMFKKCNQEKLSLWHNHCFLCCIDGKIFKWEKKRKKKTLGKRSIFVQR